MTNDFEYFTQDQENQHDYTQKCFHYDKAFVYPLRFFFMTESGKRYTGEGLAIMFPCCSSDDTLQLHNTLRQALSPYQVVADMNTFTAN